MLAVTSYKRDYVDECRKKVDRQLSAYRNLIEVANSQPDAGLAIDAFSSEFFPMMVMALDHFFLHRLRNAELKDGNPLNEVRMLCNSIMENGGVLKKDGQIKLDPKTSISRIEFGNKVELDEATFTRLARGFFDEIEKKYA